MIRTTYLTETNRNRFQQLATQPAVLLLMTGALFGFNFPLGKVAGGAGISPMVWTMIVSLGACLLLLPVLVLKRRLVLPKGRVIRYVIISAIISFVGPNLLLFSVIPHAGAGYTGLMFALSPVFTLLLAAVFRLKVPRRTGLVGIAVALLGTVIVCVTRGVTPAAPPMVWTIAALAIPVMLACGNVYRTLDWPQNASPDVLAFWGHAFSMLILLPVMWAQNGSIPIHQLALAPTAAFAQMLIAGLMFPVYFRLQQQGGPVLLSQLGYVAAAVGLIAATIFLGERYSAITWLGAAVIAIGIFITVIAQITEQRSA